MRDESKELTVRVHDECNGSDVFGSDICTCKPYLTFAIEECVRCAQRGGVGVVVYYSAESMMYAPLSRPSELSRPWRSAIYSCSRGILRSSL